MSTFYLLPPRLVLGERFAHYLQTLFPGLNWGETSWESLAQTLKAAIERHPDVYVIYREELPEGENLTQALRHGFGAEFGDQVIEVRAGPEARITRHWRLGDDLSAAA